MSLAVPDEGETEPMFGEIETESAPVTAQASWMVAPGTGVGSSMEKLVMIGTFPVLIDTESVIEPAAFVAVMV